MQEGGNAGREESRKGGKQEGMNAGRKGQRDRLTFLGKREGQLLDELLGLLGAVVLQVLRQRSDKFRRLHDVAAGQPFRPTRLHLQVLRQGQGRLVAWRMKGGNVSLILTFLQTPTI